MLTAALRPAGCGDPLPAVATCQIHPVTITTEEADRVQAKRILVVLRHGTTQNPSKGPLPAFVRMRARHSGSYVPPLTPIAASRHELNQ